MVYDFLWLTEEQLGVYQKQESVPIEERCPKCDVRRVEFRSDFCKECKTVLLEIQKALTEPVGPSV